MPETKESGVLFPVGSKVADGWGLWAVSVKRIRWRSYHKALIGLLWFRRVVITLLIYKISGLSVIGCFPYSIVWSVSLSFNCPLSTITILGFLCHYSLQWWRQICTTFSILSEVKKKKKKKTNLSKQLLNPYTSTYLGHEENNKLTLLYGIQETDTPTPLLWSESIACFVKLYFVLFFLFWDLFFNNTEDLCQRLFDYIL